MVASFGQLPLSTAATEMFILLCEIQQRCFLKIFQTYSKGNTFQRHRVFICATTNSIQSNYVKLFVYNIYSGKYHSITVWSYHHFFWTMFLAFALILLWYLDGYDDKVSVKRMLESWKLSTLVMSVLPTAISYVSTDLSSVVTIFEIWSCYIIVKDFCFLTKISSFFQMVLVAIFSETGFFDYCAVKVSRLCDGS